MNKEIKFIFAISIFVGGLISAGLTAAQNYPNRPLRIVVSFASGSGADIAARNLANELGPLLGQQVVIDNRPGASGILGYEVIARAAPDGYTLGYTAFGFATNPSMYSKLPYDSVKDFQPVILYNSSANILAVSPSLQPRSVKELIEQARAKPKTLSFGSAGLGSSMFLSMELFKLMTGTDMVHVSYKSIQQAITDAIGGQIQIVCDNFSSLVPHVRSGRMRALAVTSLKRAPAAPELPTMDEAGIAGFEISVWGGYSFPAGTPRDRVLRLNAEINKALSSPSNLKGIVERGGTPIGGTPEQFSEHLRKETEKWAKVIKTAGIKPQ